MTNTNRMRRRNLALIAWVLILLQLAGYAPLAVAGCAQPAGDDSPAAGAMLQHAHHAAATAPVPAPAGDEDDCGGLCDCPGMCRGALPAITVISDAAAVRPTPAFHTGAALQHSLTSPALPLRPPILALR